MARYLARPRSNADYIPDAYSPESMTILESEDSPEPTGILDSQGNEYFKHPDKRPVGFTAKWE